VVSGPFERSRVPVVPGPALLLGEKAPVVARIIVLHEDAHSFQVRNHSQVLDPDQRDEMRSRAVHDGHVRQDPVVVVRLQPVDQKLKIRSMFPGAHHVVGESGADLGGRHPHRICQ